jgi:hypothetical protein
VATREELLELANRIGKLGDEMGWVGDQLMSRADHTTWQCAKADRYRAALSVRRKEAHRLAKEIYFLAYWAKVQAQTAATGQPEGGR